MLANVSILEGYRWLGFLSSPGSNGPTGFTSGRVSTFVFGVLLPAAAVALTRPRPGMPRSPSAAAVVVAGVIVVLASTLVVLDGGPGAGTALGVADLGLAVGAIVAVVSSGIGRHRWSAGRRDRTGSVD